MNAAFSDISFLLSVPLQEEISYNNLLPHTFSSSFLSPLFFPHIIFIPLPLPFFLRYIGNLAPYKYNKTEKDFTTDCNQP